MHKVGSTWLALVPAALCACAAAHGPANGAGAAAGEPSVASAPPPPPAPGPLDDGRLPLTATPRRYSLVLKIDPTQPRFSGVTTIEIDVPGPTSYVVLHARDMNVARAVARANGVERVARAAARLARGGVAPEELVLSFDRPLQAGPAQLEIAYDAPFAPDLAGLYRVQEDGRWYAYTQFEANDARRAFPCFDEPGFKAAYDVTIVSPRGTTALANAPEVSQTDGADGMVAHRFQTSLPLPSYLVAFAVGEFDVAEGQREPFPIRVVTTKGRAGPTRLALDVATALVAKLGEYFDVRYPFPKLDLVAVPDFGPGAMENPGLVTFRDVLLLVDPQSATTSLRRTQIAVIAHELAHQWLGDLVTMQWWDDLWLNEGFATWAEAKVVDAWRPSFGATIDQIAETQGVMDVDALKSARAVREPVRSTGEAMEAFDGITYAKAAAVLRMIESWLGADTFRRGVQRYLQEFAWKNARAEDLFASLDYVSGQQVGRLAADFLDHSGVPQVLATSTCSGAGAGKLELRESEWRPLGAGGDPPRTWTVPVCIASDVQKTKSCFTLGAEPIARDLGPRCPAWIHPNADLAGYYRFLLDRPQLVALARGVRQLGVADRLGFVSNAWAGVRQGTAPGPLLDALGAFDGETSRQVVDQVISVLRGVEHSLVEEGARPAFRRYVAARLAGAKRRLGWEPGRGAATKDQDDEALERRSVLWTMGELAGDDATLREAEVYAARWLKDPASVPPDTAAVALPLASMRAGEARLGELRAATKTARTPEARILAIRAMGCFDDPAVLRQALDLAFTDELKLSELRHLFGSAAGHRAARPVLYAWEKENWPRLRARLPGSLARELMEVAGTMCSTAGRDDAQAFFVPATRDVEGARRPLDEALEQAGLCAALREHGEAQVTAYLHGQ